ncbi:MAG: PilZ domain-containing protein [bacterium]
MFERRQYRRTNLGVHLAVFRRGSEEPFGQLLNITPAGMMMRTETPITAKTDYQLSITLPRKLFGLKHVDFDAKSVWCQPEDHDNSSFRTGFQLLKLDHKDFESIVDLLNNFARVY